jgi:two-component system, cell cycle response regulator
MSGFELCWEARLIASSGNPLYVVVMSSSRDETKLVEALDSGADDFINTPPRKSELLARLRAAGRLLAAHRDLIKLASYDSLTDLRNRRSFFEELENCAHLESALSIIMLDVDHFKHVNDTHGHEVGDEVLREIGQRAVAIDRNFARLGGEEFGLLVRGALPVAAELAERLRHTIAATPFETSAGDLPITASIGVAQRKSGVAFDKVLKEADIALYAAKSAGRNRVTLSRSMTEGDFMLYDMPHVA